MLQVQLQKDEHVVSLVRMLINHVCKASFDVHDSVTVALKGSGNCMYVPLECAHVSFMTHEHDVQRKVVTLRARLVDGIVWQRSSNHHVVRNGGSARGNPFVHL
jgi:hypothetical protein